MDAAFQDAMRLHQSGNLAEAQRRYQEILRANPRHFHALCSLAYSHFQSRQFEQAQSLFRDALAIDARDVNALGIRGVALLELRRPADALPCFEAALRLQPGSVDARNNRATALLELGRYEEALAAFDEVVAHDSRNAHAWNNRGNALLLSQRFEDALVSFDRALSSAPDLAQAWLNRGRALAAMRRFEPALASYDRGLALFPTSAEGWQARGDALINLWRYADALASYDRVLALTPGSEDALKGRAQALFSLGRLDDAIAASEAVLERNPESPYWPGTLAFWKHCACDWDERDTAAAKLARDIRDGRRVVSPWTQLVLSASPEEQLLAARIWAEDQYRAPAAPLTASVRHDRIRVAYLSADFRVHVSAYLMAEIFEHHDRGRFETFAVSFGRNDRSEMRARLEHAFDHFLDVTGKPDAEVAVLLREAQIDIAVDLKGYTTDSRPGILSARVAPLQVSYLGFPGTMGSKTIDYLLADRVVVPKEDRVHYSERIATLPRSYYPYESAKPVAAPLLSHEEAGLPDQGFVFCSFNSSYKITPEIFDIWMRLLRDVPGSVLWLLVSNGAAVRNLRAGAQTRGVAPERLIFAPFEDMTRHRARYALADLFLDTLPCNAHTTAADALWAGLPVLTCKGPSFAGRVAASLLTAMGLPELVMPSLEAYESAALGLARDASALEAMKRKVADGRARSLLFDSLILCRELEAAFAEMHGRHERGEAPDDFDVGAVSALR